MFLRKNFFSGDEFRRLALRETACCSKQVVNLLIVFVASGVCTCWSLESARAGSRGLQMWGRGLISLPHQFPISVIPRNFLRFFFVRIELILIFVA